MDGMTLPPDLTRYADEAVASGRFLNRGEVVAAGLKLLQQADTEVAAFVKSLEDAKAEADRDGWVSLEDMVGQMNRIIEATPDRPA